MRFKIDVYDYAPRPFALYYAESKSLFGTIRWRRIEIFETKADALAFYEKIKDLPEYLP